jgi:hypothetical protein
MADTEYTKGYRAGYDFASAETEARIIKLIEPEVAIHKEQGLWASADYLTHLIALIRGEK